MASAVSAPAIGRTASISPGHANRRFARCIATFQTIEGQPANVQVVTPHREWRYHYVGHHPRFEGYWEQVR